MSCSRFTIRVEHESDGTILEAAPIAKKFIGQPIGNLVKWMEKLGGFRYQHLR